MEDGELQSRAVPAVGLRAEQAVAGSPGGSPGVGSSLEVSTQPALVGDRGVLILSAVRTPRGPWAAGMPGQSQRSSVRIAVGGGSPGAGEPEGQKFTLSPSTWAPGAGLVALGPPGTQALYHVALPLWFKMGLGNPGQPDGGRCASFLGMRVWPLLSLPSGEKSLCFNLAALHGLQDLSSLSRD